MKIGRGRRCWLMSRWWDVDVREKTLLSGFSSLRMLRKGIRSTVSEDYREAAR